MNIRASSPHQASRQSFRMLGRALGYIGHYPRAAIIAYGTLLIASLAQLAVPWLVRQIIDAITDGTLADAILGLPPAAQEQAAAVQGTTVAELQQTAAGAEDALIAVCIAIVVFAVARGVFAFLQGYMAEWLSQSIAFDFRNELFAKIQRLSFSYHDRNQTGQLMIRATDDVEKVQLCVGQGFAGVAGDRNPGRTLIILFWTNVDLTLVSLDPPLAVLMFMVFGAVSQPMFIKLQARLSDLTPSCKRTSPESA